MHKIRLSDVGATEKTLTQAVLQITQMLGIYHAELARILHLQCADIGELANSKKLLLKQSESWLQAVCFVKMYERLYEKFAADESRMYNWLRKENKHLGGVPLYLMVDELRIEDVIACLNA